jgi:hypothetical protein
MGRGEASGIIFWIHDQIISGCFAPTDRDNIETQPGCIIQVQHSGENKIMTIASHRLNLQKTYYYSNNTRLAYVVLAAGWLILTIASLYTKERPLLIIGMGLQAFCYTAIFAAAMLYRVQVSSYGISVRAWSRAWLKETFITWQDIQWVQLDQRGDMRLIYPQSGSLIIFFGIQGFNKVWETLRVRRPELFTTLLTRKFHGWNSGWNSAGIFITCSILFFVGLVGLDDAIHHFSIISCFTIAFLFVGLGGLIAGTRMQLSIELDATELVIKYPLTENRISLDDITAIRKGVGLQTRSGQLVPLGKVREGQSALYDTLLAWWRAGKREINHEGTEDTESREKRSES